MHWRRLADEGHRRTLSQQKVEDCSRPERAPHSRQVAGKSVQCPYARIAGAVFLDAYAGSGAVGIEALSRGAKHAFFFEKRADAIAVLRENLSALDLNGEATVIRGSAAILIPDHTCDIAFIDPPYELVKEYPASLAALSQTECALAIAQHSSRLVLNDEYGAFSRTRILKQGDNSLSFFERA